MDTIPLPAHPSVAEYQELATALVAAERSGGDVAVEAWGQGWLESLTKRLSVEVTPFVRESMTRAVTHLAAEIQARRSTGAFRSLTETDARQLIATAHSFESWSDFTRHLEHVAESRFEVAADAVVSGDLATLNRLLDEEPSFVQTRSARTHRATLLHYVAANGVEDFRQKSPRNAVAIARCLLERGADVDANAATYGGGHSQTTMNLLVSSVHPHAAGVQSALVDALCDHGAAVNGVRDDESPLLTALDFGYIDAATTLVRRGARVDNAITAAALGRLDLVRSFVLDAGTLAPGVPLIAPPWARVPAEPRSHIEQALVWACRFGQSEVARWLLDKDVSAFARDRHDMSALHWSAAGGLFDIVTRLLQRGASLESTNVWGGTVLSSTIHFALHMPVTGVDYPAMLEQLIAAGASVHAAHPSESAWVDALLRRHGAGTS